MDPRTREDPEAQDYAANLEYTLKELQRKVREHEAELNKVGAVHPLPPLPLPRAARVRVDTAAGGDGRRRRLTMACQMQSLHDGAAVLSSQAQATLIRSALEDVINSEPFLPFPGSVLPALLALRKTHQTVVESRAYLASQAPETERLRKRLEADRVSLRDQQLLTTALDARIQSLRQAADSGAAARPKDGAAAKAEELGAKSRSYDAETTKLMKSLLGFMDDRLAPMLAAEELGGPVVGDLMDIGPDDLGRGFNSQGRLRAAKRGARDDGRQRRIDDIWGRRGDGHGADDDDGEAAAAGREMRELTEELLNALAEAKGDNSASYVQLAKESAAARFLVRSQVAQFHPKDATRLRLVDFGRELED